MPFLMITYRWELHELAEAPCSTMPGRSKTYDLQAEACSQPTRPPVAIYLVYKPILK